MRTWIVALAVLLLAALPGCCCESGWCCDGYGCYSTWDCVYGCSTAAYEYSDADYDSLAEETAAASAADDVW